MAHSQSSLSSFEQCPRQYFYRYMAELRMPERRESISLFLGSRVHEVLEHLYRKLLDGVVITRPNLLRYFSRQWEQEWSDEIELHGSGTPESWKAIGLKCVEDYYDRHQPFDDSRTMGLERELRFTLKEDGNYPMIGYIDRLARRDGGTWEIHDYKTDKHLPSQRDKDEDRQLALYEIGVRQLWPDVREVELVWHYVRFDEEIRSHRTPEQLDQLAGDTMQLINEIKSRESEDDFPTVETKLCDWCDFQRICPVWKHKFAVAALPENEFLNEPGVELVDRWTELSAERDELKSRQREAEGEIERIKDALFALADRQQLEVVAGSTHEAHVSTKETTTFPRKTLEPDEAAAMERELRTSPWWDLVSSIDRHRLQTVLAQADGGDPRLIETLERYAVHTAGRNVTLRVVRPSDSVERRPSDDGGAIPSGD